MRLRFGAIDPFDGFPDSTGDFFLFQPAATPAVSTAQPTPVVVPVEAIQAESAQDGPGGPGSVVAETSGGLTIDLIFDAAAMAAPASFRNGIEQAAALLSATITDKITVNLNIDYSGTGGGAAAGPDNGQWVSYSTVRADLVNNASAGDTTFNALPTGSTIQGQSNVAVWNAQLKLWGLLGVNDTTTDDGSAKFATDINPNLLVGVALHELTHAMGRVPYGSQPDIFDFYRFTSPGVRLFANGSTARPAYFSLDGGNTKIADYGQTSDPSDFLNSGVQGPNDPFNEFYTSTTLQQLTAVDLKELDALGFHLASNISTTIQTDGTTSLVQTGSNYFLNNVSTGTGPELMYGGAPVTIGQFGSLTPIGAIQTASGYDIAWKIPGTNQFTFWTTDNNGNCTSNVTGGFVTGTSFTLESFETIFGQDLNGDGSIGVTSSLIQTDGSTSLLQIAENYYLYTNGSGPELKYGAPVTIGEFGSLTPIGAIQTASGYDIAWKIPGTNQFTFWTTDSNGNCTSNVTGSFVTGTSSVVELFETIFHQDLNGDGVIGPPTTVIQNDGSTSLVESSTNYFLHNLSTGAGPELMYGGAPVTIGEFGSLTPIGAIQTTSGYDIAWKIPGTNQFTFWTTDNNGNCTSNVTGGFVTGTSFTLESFETIFGQDLNGDGSIGVTSSLIQTDGSTSLLQIAENYYLYTNGSGPELKYGAPVTIGEFGSLTPIGAIQTASGYDIAWKIPGTNQFTFWTTDSNGNCTSNVTGSFVTGTSSVVESFETIFHQDLNGDGVIGVPSATSPATTQAAAAAPSGQTTFDGTTLTLEQPSTFTGQIIGFTGNGTLAGSDQIDLRGLNYNSIHSSFDGSSGTLSVNDGSTTASLQFLGQHSQDNFHLADDSSGGTLVIASTSPGQNGGSANQVVSNFAAHDTYVFAPHFGQVGLANFVPATDTLEISKSVFANISVLLAMTHDDAAGNAVVTDAAHDAITFQHVTTAQLLAHQSDFHFV